WSGRDRRWGSRGGRLRRGLPALDRSIPLPEQMRRNAAMRSPALGANVSLLLARAQRSAVGPAHGLLQGDVAGGEDVGARLAEHQESLSRPAADAFDGGQAAHGLRIRQPLEVIEVDRALDMGAGDLMGVARLLQRQAEATQGVGVA